MTRRGSGLGLRRACRCLTLVAAALLCVGVGAPAVFAAGGYESATLRASELLPPSLVKGPHHEVDERVESDGMQHTFTLRSPQGEERITGEGRLRARVREIEALAALEARGGGLGDPGPAPRMPAGGRPALPGLPEGEFVVLGEGASPEEQSALASLLGFEAKRREIAFELGVDPYTSDPALKAELDRHARAAVDRSTPLGHEPAAAEPPADDDAPRVERILRDYSSEDLERLNRLELAVMGVSPELREELLEHPAYSAAQETRLVEALAALEGTEDRAAFVELAVTAEDGDAADRFHQTADLMRQYGERSGGLARIVATKGGIAAYAADGTLVVPALADEVRWTEHVEGFAASVAEAVGEDPDVARAQVIFSGDLSPRAREGFESLGLVVDDPSQPPALDAGE